MHGLIRIFIPSWRFFDRIGARPRVLVLFDGVWHPLFRAPRPAWWRIVFNPSGTLTHANDNLTQRLLEEAMVDGVDLLKSTSYRLVEHIARARGAGRFKLVARDEDVFTSPELTT